MQVVCAYNCVSVYVLFCQPAFYFPFLFHFSSNLITLFFLFYLCINVRAPFFCFTFSPDNPVFLFFVVALNADLKQTTRARTYYLFSLLRLLLQILPAFLFDWQTGFLAVLISLLLLRLLFPAKLTTTQAAVIIACVTLDVLIVGMTPAVCCCYSDWRP